MMWKYRSCQFVALVSGVLLAAPSLRAADPLHQRIDQVMAKTHVGPVAPRASDSEFLRRAFLDLTGKIPPADAARQFLDDPAPDKRQRLVDQLLDSPEYVRHAATVFDVMLMERRRDQHVKSADWRAYLLESFRLNKPYNQLAREILEADGVDAAQRARSKFYLDRDELAVNLVTRDAARIFFGRDVECAQCHDHPTISDYEQSEYYGLLAFVDRSYLFQPDKRKPAVIAEKAEGLVKFKSVFTAIEGETLPRLPGEKEITEPVFKTGEEYQVKPAKTVRPVPKFSRRKKFAELATAGTNDAFNKNVANRLWAMLLGRGLVHPVDLHHPENPPASPELLALLSQEFVAMNYNVRAFLREVALSETYQRSFRLPDSLAPNVALAQRQQPEVSVLLAKHEKLAESLEQSLEAIDQTMETQRKAVKRLAEKLKPLAAAQATAQTVRDQAAETLRALQSTLPVKQQVAQLLEEAGKQAQAAVQKLPKDQALKQAAESLAAQSRAWSQQVPALKSKIDQQTETLNAFVIKLQNAQQQAEPLTIELTQAKTRLANAEAERKTAREKQAAALASASDVQRQLDRLSLILQYREAAEKLESVQAAEPATDQPKPDQKPTVTIAEETPEQLLKANEAFDVALAELTADWSRYFQVATVEQLSPEQLAWSTLQAVGQIEQQQQTALAQWKKAHPDLAKNELTPEQQREQAAFIEAAVFAKLQGQVTKFVTLFGANAGQPQHEFFATVDQALFLANGSEVLTWLKPGGGNLTDRLGKLEDPNQLAEELYLSVLSRRPGPEETTDVASYLAQRKTDKALAVQEMAWALLTSAEFRFQR